MALVLVRLSYDAAEVNVVPLPTLCNSYSHIYRQEQKKGDPANNFIHQFTFAYTVCITVRPTRLGLQVGRVDEDAGSVTSSHTISGGRRSSGRRVTFSPPDKGEKEPQEDNFLQVHCSTAHD